MAGEKDKEKPLRRRWLEIQAKYFRQRSDEAGDREESGRSGWHLGPLTPAQAAERVEAFGRVFDAGYLTRDRFEELKREIEARVQPTDPTKAR